MASTHSVLARDFGAQFPPGATRVVVRDAQTGDFARIVAALRRPHNVQALFIYAPMPITRPHTLFTPLSTTVLAELCRLPRAVPADGTQKRTGNCAGREQHSFRIRARHRGRARGRRR